MNKDFLSKPISLKDIDFKNFNLKNIKRKKEIVIGILFIAYIIAVIVVGKNLFATRSDLKAEYERKEARVKSLREGLSEEEIQKKINDVEQEKEELKATFYSITPAQFNDILNDFKSSSPLTWDEDKDVDVSLVKSNPGYEAYDVYSVYVKSFTGSFNQVQEFLEYVKNYDKLAIVDAINFRREEITGKMKGTLKLSFYFKKMEE